MSKTPPQLAESGFKFFNLVVQRHILIPFIARKNNFFFKTFLSPKEDFLKFYFFFATGNNNHFLKSFFLITNFNNEKKQILRSMARAYVWDFR